MIDIHNHTLYGVDDGPKDIEKSISMLCEAKKNGIDRIILTPHYRHGMFPYSLERILKHFGQLKEEAEKLDMELYLGCEYHVNSSMVEYLNTGRCLGMAGSRYVLAEYSFDTEFSVICATCDDLLANGYLPIIAHIERYKCFLEDFKRVEDIRRKGVKVQINADSVLGQMGFGAKRFCKKLLKYELADFVASDAHDMEKRSNNLAKAYAYITKKYDEGYAKLLMDENPRRIIEKSFK